MPNSSLESSYNKSKSAKSPGKRGFSLSEMALANPDAYRAMSPVERLDLLQGQISDGNSLNQVDGMLLRMLRRRVARENAAQAAPESAAQQGVLARLSHLLGFDAAARANPYGIVSSELQRVNEGLQ